SNATGSWNGTGAHYAAGKVGAYAGQCNGTDDYVYYGGAPLGAPVAGHTMIVWFKPSALAVATNVLVSQGDYHYLSFHVAGDTPFHSALVGGSQKTISGSTAVTTGSWYMVAGRYDGSRLTVWLNGQLDGALNASGNDGSGSGFAIGRFSPGGYFTSGLVDEVRIYNRALSAAEIAAIYNATK
ncbi:MAG: LamG domain-containing protein, partial [Patescibacteria group bacterium]